MAILGQGEALRNWIQGWNDLVTLNGMIADDEGLGLFIVPNASPDLQYINGDDEKTLMLSLNATLPYSVGQDDVNIKAQRIVESWYDWVSEQFGLKNVPDFGDSEITDISPTGSAPAIAQIYENDTAKYQFSAQITYIDKTKGAFNG